MQDHMLFLLAEKQDDLIRSSAKFYTSETKLLLPRDRSPFISGATPVITPEKLPLTFREIA